MKGNSIFFIFIVTAGVIVMLLGLVGAQTPGQSYISVDPIEDMNSGDLLLVTGTTNLPIGSELLVQVIEEPVKSDNDSEKSVGTGTGTTTKVLEGEGVVNRWAAPIDTSVLRPDTYRVDVVMITRNQDNGDFATGNTSGTAHFTLMGEYLGPELPIPTESVDEAFISVDPVGTRYIGDRFLVTGSTSLPLGTGVIWRVVPVISPSDSTTTGTFSGMMANSIVTKGNGEINRVSLALDTNSLQPGLYNISVSDVVGDIRKGDFSPGNFTGIVEMTLQ